MAPNDLQRPAPVYPPHKGENEALIDFVNLNLRPHLTSLSRPAGPNGAVIALPHSQRLESIKPFLDEYLPAPERRQGTAKLTDAASFIAHVNRFKDSDSAIFAAADPKAPQLVGVIDYHRRGEKGEPRFGRHRAVYACPLSEEWQAWTGHDGQKMAQGDFAEFIEDRIGDLVAAPAMSDRPEDAALQETAAMLGGRFCQPSTLMELSKCIQVHASERVHQAVNLATGEIQIQYAGDHGEAGARFTASNLFLICVPVFENGPLYRLVGRLRYRLSSGQITWFYDLWRADKVFRHAFDEVCDRAAKETGLPVFRGTPEA